MASRSLNRVMLIGNLTRDPELKYTQAGTGICTFGVATNRTWKTRDGQTKDDVQYHRIVAWQKLAELCGKLLSKGSKVFLEGRITYRTFTGRDGQEKSITEIILDDFIVFTYGKRTSTDFQASQAEQPEGEVKIEEEGEKEKEKEGEGEKKEEESNEEKEQEKEKKGKKEGEETEQNDQDINPEDIPF